MILESSPCELGEGAFWHPVREELFWFDILNRSLHSQTTSWRFPEIVSAAAWIDNDQLMIASETGLLTFDLGTGDIQPLVSVGGAGTRSNDGRADRQGGFWFGTMGKRAEPGAGAIWRWYGGELRRLFGGLTIPNAICFTSDGAAAHFSDTVTGKVMKVALDAQGWPIGAPQVWLDLTQERLNPDGAVVDASGLFWNAQWGAARVAAYAPDGSFVRAANTPGAPQASCPAFGGRDMKTLFVTTAWEGMTDRDRALYPASGKVFVFPGLALGLPEPQVRK